MAFLQIPGNIKQAFSPFVLLPGSNKNKIIEPGLENSTALNNASPQIFSFRPHPESNSYSGGFGELGFYPNAAKKIMEQMNNDMSFKSLYSMEGRFTEVALPLQLSDILNRIPCVSIREYIPDPRLEQAWNLFQQLIKPIAEIGNIFKTIAQSDDMWKATKDALKYLLGASTPNMFDDPGFVIKGFDNINFSPYNTQGKGDYAKQIKYILNFPYFMYYRLQSSTTTNIYEVPAITDDKKIISSSGKTGWDDVGHLGMDFGSSVFGSSMLANVANFMFGSVGVNYLPFWNPASARKSLDEQVSVKFDLFNDNIDRAIINFIFVNTIAPNNKWLQYHMFSHSSSIYDIKIEGINRLFACAGDVTISYGGVLRDPSAEFINRLVNSYANKKVLNCENLLSSIVNNKLIKIPDVYHVKLDFKSLLPSNFNNFLYVYSRNMNHITSYGSHAYEDNSENIKNILTAPINGMIEYVKTQQEDAAANNLNDAMIKSGEVGIFQSPNPESTVNVNWDLTNVPQVVPDIPAGGGTPVRTGHTGVQVHNGHVYMDGMTPSQQEQQ